MLSFFNSVTSSVWITLEPSGSEIFINDFSVFVEAKAYIFWENSTKILYWEIKVTLYRIGSILVQISGVVGEPPLQWNPVSILQAKLQPSPSKVFPSSHSDSNFLPSPHISIHSVGFRGEDLYPVFYEHYIQVLSFGLTKNPS